MLSALLVERNGLQQLVQLAQHWPERDDHLVVLLKLARFLPIDFGPLLAHLQQPQPVSG